MVVAVDLVLMVAAVSVAVVAGGVEASPSP